MGILASHKNQVTYLEYAKVIKADERVGYTQENSGVQYTFALPYGNMAVLLLGPGTSITQAAMHHLCAEGCLVGFTGGGGFPIFCGGLSEYRPTEYAQAWLTRWQSEAWRLEVARLFQRVRVALVNKQWARYGLSSVTLGTVATAGDALLAAQDGASTKEALLGHEAVYAKRLYQALAVEFDVAFKREPQVKGDYVNELIDAHNYYAYGIAGAALWTLGIPFSFPVLHGETRRGALVFDVADMFKDGILLPLAFISNKEQRDKGGHRKECAKWLHLENSLNLVFREVQNALGLGKA